MHKQKKIIHNLKIPKFPSHPTEKRVTVHSKVDISRLRPAYPNAFLRVFLVVIVMVVLKFGDKSDFDFGLI